MKIFIWICVMLFGSCIVIQLDRIEKKVNPHLYFKSKVEWQPIIKEDKFIYKELLITVQWKYTFKNKKWEFLSIESWPTNDFRNENSAHCPLTLYCGNDPDRWADGYNNTKWQKSEMQYCRFTEKDKIAIVSAWDQLYNHQSYVDGYMDGIEDAETMLLRQQ